MGRQSRLDNRRWRPGCLSGKTGQRGHVIVEYLAIAIFIVTAIVAFQGPIQAAINNLFSNGTIKIIDAGNAIGALNVIP